MPSILQPVDPNEQFKLRRIEARRRRRKRQLVVAGLLLALITSGVVGAVLATHIKGHQGQVRASAAAKPKAKSTGLQPRPLPIEIRGVHVTMALASLRGKRDEYIRLKSEGLNTIELDVKDENGEVAFAPANVPLARHVGAAGHYYNPVRAAAKIHNAGLYLIGRVVTFEDPLLSAGAPSLAVRRADGSRWLNNAGVGWTNPYDTRVWRYNVSIAEAAARAGFDEIQFDYVRFPSDGDITQIRYPGRHAQPKGWTIPMFLKYARERLRPLGVRISADVFGLSATRNLGIAQFPRRMAPYLDALYPMVYPSHYSSGEFNITEPDARPGATVAYSLRDFQRAVRGRRAVLIPWLQDFSLGHRYTLSDIRDEIQAARLEHVKGFMLWNPSGVYTKGALGTPAFR